MILIHFGNLFIINMLKLLADINDKVLSFSAGNTSFQFSFCFSYSVIYIYVPALLGAGFQGDGMPDGYACLEMRQRKTWTWQVDSFALCATAHALLHPPEDRYRVVLGLWLL